MSSLQGSNCESYKETEDVRANPNEAQHDGGILWIETESWEVRRSDLLCVHRRNRASGVHINLSERISRMIGLGAAVAPARLFSSAIMSSKQKNRGAPLAR